MSKFQKRSRFFNGWLALAALLLQTTWSVYGETTAGAAAAGEDDLSLESLLNIKITTASKKAEDLFD